MKLFINRFVPFALCLSLFACSVPNEGPTELDKTSTVIPVDPEASEATRDVLNYLVSVAESGRILSGQHLYDDSSIVAQTYLTYIEELARQTGKYVAVLGTGYVGNRDEINAILRYHWSKNGLVTLDFHAHNPWTGGPAMVPDADRRGPKPNLRELLDRSTDAGRAWHDELDSIAAGLQALEDAGVVVLWRPLHEMNGNFFWWGVDMTNPSNTQDFKDLWIHMYDYFTDTKGLHNLLWVYSPATSWDSSVKAFYPGDEYVDLVGYDRYDDTLGEWTDDKTGVTSTDYADLQSLGKPMAFSEVGPITRDGSWDTRMILERMRLSNLKMTYFMSWQSWLADGVLQHVALVDNQYTRELLTSDTVITRDELPSRGGASTTLAISPVLECVVQLGTNQYTAFFGYKNPNPDYTFVPAGPGNTFAPSPGYKGQTLIFAPGRSPSFPNAAFSVAFSSGKLVWKLGGRTSTASVNSKRCPSTVSTGNLLTNSGFETGDLTGWENWRSFTVAGADRFAGNHAALIAPQRDSGGGAQKISVTPNSSYVLSAWGKATGGQWAAVGYTFLDGAGKPIGGEVYLAPFGMAYSYRTGTLLTPAGTATLQVQVWSADGGSLYLDEVSLTLVN